MENSEKAGRLWGWEAVVVMVAYPFIAAKGGFREESGLHQ